MSAKGLFPCQMITICTILNMRKNLLSQAGFIENEIARLLSEAEPRILV
jgi:hypothetical protein